MTRKMKTRKWAMKGSEEEEKEEDKDQNMEDGRANDTSEPNIVQEVHTYQVKFEGKELGLEVTKGKERLVWVSKVLDGKLKKKIRINDIISSVNNEKVGNNLKFIQSPVRPLYVEFTRNVQVEIIEDEEEEGKTEYNTERINGRR